MTDSSWTPLLEVLTVFVVVLALQVVAGLVNLTAGLFVLSPPLLENPWTAVTSVYAHANVGHLLSNAVALVLFGLPVAAATTRLRFHLFFLVTGAIAGVSQLLVSGTLAELPFVDATATGGVLGASGAVFALLGYLLASNRLAAGLGSVADPPRWVTYLVFVALAGAVTYLTAAPGVALIAHFTGLLLGLLAGQFGLLGTRVSQGRESPSHTVR